MRSQKQKLSSIESNMNKKAVGIIKCFICSQIMYSQEKFDQHMDQHSQKLSKNVPQQIQRKTMESFKMKKNSNQQNTNNTGLIATKKDSAMLKNKNTNDIKNGNIVRASSVRMKPKTIDSIGNKTIIGMNSKISDNYLQKKSLNTQSGQEKKDKKTVIVERNKKAFQSSKQIRDAMRQSSQLIQKIQSFTQNYVEKLVQSEHNSQEQEQNNNFQDPYIVKTMSEAQFMKLLLTPNCNYNELLEHIESVEFQSSALVSYQEQLLYLSRLKSISNSEELNIAKIQQIRYKIVDAIKEVGMQLVPLNYYNNQHISNKISHEDLQKVDNNSIAYCTQCYQIINYDEKCYRYSEKGKDPVIMHVGCWDEVNQKQ